MKREIAQGSIKAWRACGSDISDCFWIVKSLSFCTLHEDFSFARFAPSCRLHGVSGVLHVDCAGANCVSTTVGPEETTGIVAGGEDWAGAGATAGTDTANGCFGVD